MVRRMTPLSSIRFSPRCPRFRRSLRPRASPSPRALPSWTGYSAKRDWLLAHQAVVEAMVADWDGFKHSVTLPTSEQFDEVSHASGLPTRAAELGTGYDDGLLFWALRNSYLLRERISIVD